VAELRVKEGLAVVKGEELLVLDTDRATRTFGTTGDVDNAAVLVNSQIEARRVALMSERVSRQSQAQVHRQAIFDRFPTIDSELAKLDDEISLQTRRKELAELNVKRYEDLVNAKFVSPVQVQTQQEALIDQDVRLSSLERAKLTLRRERAGLAAEERQIAAQLGTELATADRELAALNQEITENDARRTTVVVAPRAGTISAISIGLGQFVTAGQSLAALQPKGTPLEAHLYAPSRTVGFVAVGQAVLIRYAAYPYQKFGLQSGKVAEVSQSAFAPSDLPLTLQTLFGRQGGEALYRVTVTLDTQGIATYGETRQLKAGMALEADIIQDRRTIIEWMLEPIFAVAKRA
jgi:membrane fusion protein